MKWIDTKPNPYACWTIDNARHDDIYDAIGYAAEREINMNEKKIKGICFDKLEKTLREMGIFLTEIRQDSYNDYAEITCKVNPIDLYISLDGCDERDPLAKKKDTRPHPKKVIFCGPATTILWKDGTKTTVKCSDEDVWENEVGIAMCYLKKLLGNKGNYNNIFREAMKVAEVQESKETTASNIDNDMLYDADMARIKKNIKDAADALSKVIKEKK